MTVFEDSFSEEIWKVTYKHFNDATVDDTLRRVATAAASVEETEEKKAEWGQKFYEMLSDFKVTVGGRIYANAGTGWGGTTLMNCVSGDTMIHTRDGVVPARTLEGREVDTLSQDGIFRKASWYCYGEQELYRVAFSNGDEVFATANHEWVTPNARGGFYRVKTTDMLGKTVPIQHISSFSYDETEYLEGVRHGLTFGDGWKYMDGKYSMLRQFTDSQPLIAEFFSGYHTHSAQLTNGLNYTQVTKLPAEYKSLPSTDASRSYLRGFIAGLIGADGHVDARGHAMIHISNEATANAVRILCTHAGIGVTSITKVRTENPFNGEPSSLFKLAITKASLYGDKFMLIKASHRENMAASKKPRNRAVVKVVSVSPTGRTEPVYCCVEPETHTMVVGNGYLTGQCFVGPITEGDFDSLDGIYKALLDQARTLKSEGGWGFNFSFIRPRGSFIHGIGVESPGAVRFMELFDKSSEIITSGSGEAIKNKKAKGKIRKGAMMGVLNAWHPDVIEFITAKQTPGRLTKFNLSVNCTDDFMDKVIRVMDMKAAGAAQELIDAADQWDLVFPDTTHEAYRKEWAGDLKNWKNKGYPVVTHRTVSATWLWNLIMESTYNRAEPGVLFLDRANKLNPLSYKETIYATNPSMPAGTKVHTRDGIFDIETLQDKTFMVKSLDGQWAEAKCFKSGVNKELVQFNFDHTGFKFVRSTKEHRWPVYDKRMGRIYKVYASEVKPGDLIPLNRNETIGIEGDASLTRDEGFMLGYLVGDGWFGKRDNGDYYAGFVFGPSEAEYKNAQRICEIINGMMSEKSTVCQTKNGYEVRTTSTEFCNLLMTRFGLIPGEKTFPEVVWSSNDSFIEGFVDGLLSSDGCVNVKQRVIHFTSSRKDIAVSFAKLLSFAGINASIYTSTKKSKFPNGKDYGKEYTRYDVKINGSMCGRFYNVFNITHETKAAKLNALVSSTKIRESIFNDYIEVKSVQYGGMEDVWDISVYHDQHVFPAEWSYTGNCGEQMLAPGGVCNLASLNLTQFVKSDLSGFDLPKVRTFVGYMVRFLDNVSSLSLAPLPEYEQSMRTKRRIGCGVLGWGSALFMLKTRFGSAEAHAIREELMRTIAHAAYEASIDLAEEKGMFAECVPELHAEGEFIKQIGLPDHLIERMKKVGIRNSALLSCQPTGNCQTPDTTVRTAEGVKSLAEIAEENGYDIYSMEAGSVVKLKTPLTIPTIEGEDVVEEIYVNGVREVIPILLEDDTVLSQTGEHRYLVKINDDYADWVFARDLKPGMKIISLAE